jgi:hypothetical protein
VGVALEAELLKSGGYEVVAPAARGPVDGVAPSQHAAVNARLEAAPSPELSFSARGGWFRETENGGTEFTTAAVRQFQYAGSVRYAPAGAGVVDLALFGHIPTFDQDRARIPGSARAQEFHAESQTVPAHDLGAGFATRSRRSGSPARTPCRSAATPGASRARCTTSSSPRARLRLIGVFLADAVAAAIDAHQPLRQLHHNHSTDGLL